MNTDLTPKWLREVHQNSYVCTRDIIKGIGISCAALYHRIDAGQFPPPDMTMRTKHYWKVKTILHYYASDERIELVENKDGEIIRRIL